MDDKDKRALRDRMLLILTTAHEVKMSCHALKCLGLTNEEADDLRRIATDTIMTMKWLEAEFDPGFPSPPRGSDIAAQMRKQADESREVLRRGRTS